MGRRARLGLGLPLKGSLLLALIAPPAAGYPEIRINSDLTTELQNEEQICVNPTDPDNVVACWRDFRLGYRQVGVGTSFDGGYTWNDFLIGGEMPWDSDPVLIVHRDGTFYLVVMNFVTVGSGPNQLSVHRSTTGGATWDGPFRAVYSSGSTFEDKEWIAVDRTGGPRDGYLYLAWARFYEARIMFVRSSNRAVAWSTPIPVSDAGVSGQWPVPVVLANGNVLVAWNDLSTPRISYDLSTNGGLSWGADRVLATTTTVPGQNINGGILVFPYPSLVVDETAGPRGGWAYCLYADAAVAGSGMDIWCRRSTDHGLTWSSRVRVNDDPPGLFRDQFHPWVACDETGVLHAIWYDRRDDSANFLWHIYYAWSTDGGATWAVNERLTSVPSSPAQAGAPEGGTAGAEPGLPLSLRAGLIGEYSGIAVRGGVVHPIWTDTRNGNQDVFTSVLASPAGVAAPGPVAASPRVRILCSPNPAPGASDLRLALPAPAEGAVEIHAAGGRRLRVLPAGRLPAGEAMLRWDGLDAAGAAVPSGVYFLRFVDRAGAEAGAPAKLVIAR